MRYLRKSAWKRSLTLIQECCDWGEVRRVHLPWEREEQVTRPIEHTSTRWGEWTFLEKIGTICFFFGRILAPKSSRISPLNAGGPRIIMLSSTWMILLDFLLYVQMTQHAIILCYPSSICIFLPWHIRTPQLPSSESAWHANKQKIQTLLHQKESPGTCFHAFNRHAHVIFLTTASLSLEAWWNFQYLQKLYLILDLTPTSHTGRR